VPLDTLLSSGYGEQRRGLIGATASLEQRPGSPDGRTPIHLRDDQPTVVSVAGMGEPTVPGATAARPSPGPHDGDTCHVDVVDQFGNFVSATPSGGWLQSSPTIPALGFSLGTRMQMFDLDDGAPNQVAAGRRPRTTLSPSLALRDGLPWLAFGTPGGDQQDQWALQFFLSVAAYGDNLQLAIDRPAFNTAHLRSSFAPRVFNPGRLYLEERFPARTIAELEGRGHEVFLAGPWSLSRVCAVGRAQDAVLLGAANARGMEAYAAGR
jgi:gamma-glutamyltranspeptidase/glutathione hydrolase